MSNKGLEHLCIQVLRVPSSSTKQKPLTCEDDKCLIYILQLRLQAIKRCEETIMNAIRQGDPNVIQAGCVTQWNLILALLQPNLRRHVRKPLTLLADALEDIQRYGAT